MKKIHTSKNNNYRAQGSGKHIITKKIISLILIGILASSVVAALGFSGMTNGNSNFQLEEIMHDPNAVAMHTHVQLKIEVDGANVVIPANIGIIPELYRGHSLDSFGTTNPPMAPLHTHDTDGVIHIESTTIRTYTLRDFLDIWGVQGIDDQTATLIVDRELVEDFRSHVLRDGQNIVLELS